VASERTDERSQSDSEPYGDEQGPSDRNRYRTREDSPSGPGWMQAHQRSRPLWEANSTCTNLATRRPLAANQRTGFEAGPVVDVVDDTVDKFLRQSRHDCGRRSIGGRPVRLDHILKLTSGHPAVSLRPSHLFTASDAHPSEPTCPSLNAESPRLMLPVIDHGGNSRRFRGGSIPG